ncbi:dihydrodipicolinate synthase family protein [Deminuibacter soli]|uniref:Dihydrodipicolinate synthase family protein n=1 Tax=Deminuibacter soli TaxID=2291815 RepID=A0A3E1NHP8_9BACT|nr:dihydrodipicolinate synthase family protein [Deminuibacter soli]RFM27473.1 dihydrodipicolinate synthase family protein [Deminuibacter soli]
MRNSETTQLPLTAHNLKGNWATLLLPVNADESIDYNRLAAEIDYLIAVQPDGIYSNGTAGEWHNQTEEEFDKIQQLLAHRCRKAGVRFQVGAAHASSIVALQRIQRSVPLLPDAFQVILPDWVVTTTEESIVYLQRLAVAAGNIPLVLYNPPHAKQVLSPAALRQLQQAVPQLIGIKTAGGNSEWYDVMRPYANDLSVFVPGHLLASGVRQQVASGSYSNVACLSPAGAQYWWQLMQTDLPAALHIEQRLHLWMDLFIRPLQAAGYSNPALDKFMAAVGGWSVVGTRLRWPYRWVPADVIPEAALMARQLLPELFS